MLTRLKDFESVLRDYELSKPSQQLLHQMDLVLLTAPSGTGRNTIIKQLIKTGNYNFIISDTTRPPRLHDSVMEKNGVEYFFRSESEVLADLKRGEFLEAAIIHSGQQVSGISMRELAKANTREKIAITDVEIIGASNIVSLKPDTKSFFVLPPNFDEWQRRLQHRGPMADAEMQLRVQSAELELEAALNKSFYIFVVNNIVELAAAKINHIVRLDEIDELEQKEARTLAEKLLQSTRDHLTFVS